MAEKPRTRVPKQSRAVDTKNRIVVIADRLITTLVLDGPGITNLSTGDVIREAGISPGTFYDYFKDQNELIAAVHESHATLIQETILSLYRRPEGFDSAAHFCDEVFLAIAAFAETNPGHRALRRAGSQSADRRDRESTLMTTMCQEMDRLGFVRAPMEEVVNHVNMTWRISEAMLREAFDMAADRGQAIGPPDDDAVQDARAVMAMRMTDPKLFVLPATEAT